MDEFNKMLIEQNGKCAVCLEELKMGVSGGGCVDHDHKNGTVRGLLCRKCNSGLGQFRDNRLFLESAIKYLFKSENLT